MGRQQGGGGLHPPLLGLETMRELTIQGAPCAFAVPAQACLETSDRCGGGRDGAAAAAGYAPAATARSRRLHPTLRPPLALQQLPSHPCLRASLPCAVLTQAVWLPGLPMGYDYGAALGLQQPPAPPVSPRHPILPPLPCSCFAACCSLSESCCRSGGWGLVSRGG